MERKGGISGEELARLAAAIEGERRRAGEELHDGVCQSLAGASLILQRLEHELETGQAIGPPLLARLKAGVEMALEQIRLLAPGFERAAASEGTLMMTLARLCAAVPGCRFACERPVFVRNEETALALCRIAQEALNNARRHARATETVVELRAADGRIELEVRDNGSGFQAERDYPVSSGLGMMRTRAEALGGTMKIESRPGQGTRVRVSVWAEAPRPPRKNARTLPPEAGPDKPVGTA